MDWNGLVGMVLHGLFGQSSTIAICSYQLGNVVSKCWNRIRWRLSILGKISCRNTLWKNFGRGWNLQYILDAINDLKSRLDIRLGYLQYYIVLPPDFTSPHRYHLIRYHCLDSVAQYPRHLLPLTHLRLPLSPIWIERYVGFVDMDVQPTSLPPTNIPHSPNSSPKRYPQAGFFEIPVDEGC